MRAGGRLFPLVGLIGVVGFTAAAALAVTVSWGSALEVPGTETLNTGGTAAATSVSCAPAGGCAVGGYVTDAFTNVQAFVADETSGVWGKAIKVPGVAARNLWGDARVTAISCPSAGNCSAGGYYRDKNGFHAFLADEKAGVWGKAIRVPGLGATSLTSISCAGVGNCAAGGSYLYASSHSQAFVVDEKNGIWGKATGLGRLAALNAGKHATVTSISCAKPGGCAVVGSYRDGSHRYRPFVAGEKNGVWGKAARVWGLATMSRRGDAALTSLSCARVGNCAAGGYYHDASKHQQAFVVDEKGGVWRKAAKVPNSLALNLGGRAKVSSISCAAAGSCAAGGFYRDGSGHAQAFVVDENGGVWGSAIAVPGMATLNLGGNAGLLSISCASVGNCAAGGYYVDGSSDRQAFLVSEESGVWGDAIEAPGTASLNVGGHAQVNSISCASTGECAAGGLYVDGFDREQAFVTAP